jgi:hypothetical protein
MTTVTETWAIVELMGHVRLGGRLTEEERFGVKLGRLDIPSGETFVTRFFGGSSVYCITIVSEEAARAVAQRTPEPVQPWELPKQLTATVHEDDSVLPY